ncbi:MAG: hypothetical protein US36_C0020G0005 [Candidatus Wolfebacteria bacterium GW2011_GWC1_37_10]|uniref:Uncharacterized protein n=1 Tax=Candidatus Wolfebacteria bacterium GW2011_GWC1_37_10 TaxID=1619010 RepID=A0A0G0FU70_9BACT|nr:MAG: hypothetical protein US36_C0020G0005 [Candidatus Wolfebacteria bacterium GW2011_GWC1_37_10]
MAPDADKKAEIIKTAGIVSKEERAVLEKITGGSWKKYTRVTMAALGILPWVGSLLGAAATLSSENDQEDTTKLLFLWIKEHEIKLKELGATLNSIFGRFESFGERINTRIESEEYLGLVRKTFKKWDEAETLEKREMLRKLITNAGGITVVQDDWVRMFLDWIEQYHELHFSIIAQIHQNPGITREAMWMNVKGSIPKDNSAEADMFKLLIDDLTRGRVIRQKREVNSQGQFYKKQRREARQSDFMESPFDDEDPYVLTELGTGFVQYVMNELTPQIGDGDKS